MHCLICLASSNMVLKATGQLTAIQESYVNRAQHASRRLWSLVHNWGEANLWSSCKPQYYLQKALRHCTTVAAYKKWRKRRDFRSIIHRTIATTLNPHTTLLFCPLSRASGGEGDPLCYVQHVQDSADFAKFSHTHLYLARAAETTIPFAHAQYPPAAHLPTCKNSFL